MSSVRLTAKGRRWMQGGHPWIYRDDLSAAEAEAGDLVALEDPQGALVGWGSYSAASRIAVRIVTREKAEPGPAFWEERVARARAVRERLGLADPQIGRAAWREGVEIRVGPSDE